VRRSCYGLDNHAAFPEFCAKAKNGFVAPENCFVVRAGRNNPSKNPMISSQWVKIPVRNQTGPDRSLG
jgi:hypothetical protein